MKQIQKITGFSIVLLLVVGLSLKLFYPDFRFFQNQVDMSAKDYTKDITIGLSSTFQDFEPTLYDAALRNRLLQVYEPLVMPDKNLNMKPVLALSYGQIDDKSWQFRLRKGVKFHNGSKVTSEDVVESVKRAKTYEKSQLKDLLANIAKVRKLSETELIIDLVQPDPLFLNKISTVLIVPTKFEEHIGTGPYIYVAQKEGNLSLKRNDLYWGEKPLFKTANLLALDSISRWAQNINNVELGFSLPPSLIDKISDATITVPSLELTYLTFNFSSEVFQNIDIREAVKLVLDRQELAELLGVKPATQFVSSGVYGFNLQIELPEKDLKLAKTYVKAIYAFNRQKVSLDALKDHQHVAEFIKKQLSDIGLDVEINLLSFEDLEQKILSRKSDMYLFAFRSDLGDVYDFYTSAVALDAQYNGANYRSEVINKRINESSAETNAKKRLELLREIMDVLVNDDIYGVPLYETQSTYMVKPDLQFEPRIDGYVLIKEIQ